MKTKKLFTSLAAAVMLSAGLAGSGVIASQPVHAATTQSSNAKKGTTISVRFRSITATVKNNNPKLIVVANGQTKTTTIDSNYTAGQTINVCWSNTATQGNNSVTLYYIENRTINGQSCRIYIPSTDVTPSAAVPTEEAFAQQRQNDVKAIQDAYNNRSLKYIVVTPKSKKGAKIYYAYKKTRKSKKIYFAASKKKIKHGKTRYVYIGKKRYVRSSAVKIVSAKYAPLKLSADLKSLIVEN